MNPGEETANHLLRTCQKWEVAGQQFLVNPWRLCFGTTWTCWNSSGHFSPHTGTVWWANHSNHDDVSHDQARREGGKGEKFSQAPQCLGSRRRSKILKMVFQMASFWPKICIKSMGELTTLPEPVVYGEGTPLPTFPPSRPRRMEGVIGPRCGSRRACPWQEPDVPSCRNPVICCQV